MVVHQQPKLARKLIEGLQAEPGKRPNLAKISTRGEFPAEIEELGEKQIKKRSKASLQHYLDELAEAQELLWASDSRSVLIVLQAMDAAGKDGTIRHVMSGVNPQGCVVHGFKKPTSEELDHDFLWRYVRKSPRRGEITIFNRSYYEDVLVVKVHPEILDSSKIPEGPRGSKFWHHRYRSINAMEDHLTRSGTLILKFFLHVGKEEQRLRFLERLRNPEKHWKFSEADMVERGYWDDYQTVFEDAIEATSTEHAPWYIIPADRKYVARTLVAMTVADAISKLDLEWPKVDEERRERQREALAQLLAEGPVDPERFDWLGDGKTKKKKGKGKKGK